MRGMRNTIAALLFLSTTTAFAAPPTPASADDAAAKYAQAIVKGTAADVAAFFADEGELQLPGMDALHGPAAIRDFLAPMAANVVVDACTMTSDLTTVSGDNATQFGHYAQTAGEKGKEHKQYTGRFAALWHWDGTRWKIVRLMMQPK